VLEDICRAPYKVTSSENAVLLLTFIKPLKTSLSSDDVLIELNYSVRFSVRDSSSMKAFIVNVELTPTPTTEVTLLVSVRDGVSDVLDFPVSLESHSVMFNFPAASSSASQSEAVKQTSQVTTLGAMAAVLGFSMLSGSPVLLFSMINTLQFISIIQLMNTDLPPAVSGLLAGTNPTNILPNFNNLLVNPNMFPRQSRQAEDYGLSTSNILYNLGKPLSALVLTIITHILLLIGSKFSCCSSLLVLCLKYLSAFQATAYECLAITCFQDVTVMLMLQLQDRSFESPLDIAGFVAALVVGICVFSLTTALAFVGILAKNGLSSNWLYKPLKGFFKTADLKKLETFEPSMFCIHRLTCIVVVTVTDNIYVQLLFCILASICVMFTQRLVFMLFSTRFAVKELPSIFIESCSYFCVAVVLPYEVSSYIASSFPEVYNFYAAIALTLIVGNVKSIVDAVKRCRKQRASIL
jgi:hypothetical protein